MCQASHNKQYVNTYTCEKIVILILLLLYVRVYYTSQYIDFKTGSK